MNGSEERWQELFADLQQNFLGQERIERSYLVSDLKAAELATFDLSSRLTANVENEVCVQVVTARQYSGVLTGVHDQWLELAQAGGGGSRRMIPLGAIEYVTIQETANAKIAPQKTQSIKETLSSGIRSVALQRKIVAIETRSNETEGIIVNVAKDYFEVILKAKPGQAGKHHKMLIPLTKLVTLRASV